MGKITERHDKTTRYGQKSSTALLCRLFGNREEWLRTLVVLECSQCAIIMRQLRLAAQQRLVLVYFLLHLHHDRNTEK